VAEFEERLGWNQLELHSSMIFLRSMDNYFQMVLAWIGRFFLGFRTTTSTLHLCTLHLAAVIGVVAIPTCSDLP